LTTTQTSFNTVVQELQTTQKEGQRLTLALKEV